MEHTHSWYQFNPPTNSNISRPGSRTAIDSIGEGPRSIIQLSESESGGGDGEDNLEEESDEVVVTLKNKIICTLAFAFLMATILVYVIFLIAIHAGHPHVVDLSRFSGPVLSVYVIFGIDFIFGIVGIWACLVKTGHLPMIISCGWLVLSSLGNLCVTVSLIHEDEAYKKSNAVNCQEGNETNLCRVYRRLETFLWYSLILIGLKFLVVVLCRFNYPQAFDWLFGRQVLVDEEILKQHMNKSGELARVATMGAMFSTPPNVNQLAARGALGGDVQLSSDSQAILVMKRDDFEDDGDGSDGFGDSTKKKSGSGRRSTMVSLESGALGRKASGM